VAGKEVLPMMNWLLNSTMRSLEPLPGIRFRIRAAYIFSERIIAHIRRSEEIRKPIDAPSHRNERRRTLSLSINPYGCPRSTTERGSPIADCGIPACGCMDTGNNAQVESSFPEGVRLPSMRRDVHAIDIVLELFVDPAMR
jgi:hypothetical protein